ncbi:HEAT repeat domain-containing protein [bacterium]|nr:HEAT repeat domain-containing protein [bacterium]
MTVTFQAQSRFLCLVAFAFYILHGILLGAQVHPKDVSSQVTCIPDFEIRLAASAPLVGYPMMACLDDSGRLYVAESDGRNLTTRAAIERELPRFVRRLVDQDGDGVYDTSTIFADQMTMPEGGLWHDGALYIIAAPYLWRLEDLDDDGVADRREKILGHMEFDGRANQHGPYLGPNGRFYFSGGHFGYDLLGTDGSRSGVSRAAGIFSCWPDGSDVQVEGQGGVNPVEMIFTRNGDMLSTCAIFDSFGGRRHDALIHWMRGGLTQRVYGNPLIPETGCRLPAVSRWGQVAPAGLMRYRGNSFGEEYRDSLFACHFNTHKVVHVRLEARNGTFVTVESDFVTSEDVGFHPTDILEDADGSLLLLDTGGWLSWGCPYSKTAKPEIKGAIYRIQRKSTTIHRDPRGHALAWESLADEPLVQLLADLRPAVRDRAAKVMIEKGETGIESMEFAFKQSKDPEFRKRILWVISRMSGIRRLEILKGAVLDVDEGVRQVAAKSLGRSKDPSSGESLGRLLNDPSPFVRATAAEAIGHLSDKTSLPLLFRHMDAMDPLHTRHAFVYALMQMKDPVGLKTFLHDDSQPYRQKIALRVLHALESDLDSASVLPLLNSEDLGLREEARRVVSSRKEWQDEMLRVFREISVEENPKRTDLQLMEGMILSCAHEKRFQELLLETLATPRQSPDFKVQVLSSLAFLDKLPETLHACVLSGLNAGSPEIRNAALGLAQRFEMRPPILDNVSQLAQNEDLLPVSRVGAMKVLVGHHGQLSGSAFGFLTRLVINEKTPVILAQQAAQVLGSLHLHLFHPSQRDAYMETLARAHSFCLPALIRPFVSAQAIRETEELEGDPAAWNLLGVRLAAALAQNTGLTSLQQGQGRVLLEAFSDPSSSEAHLAISSLIHNGASNPEHQAASVQSLMAVLDSGNASRGRVLFHDARIACGNCHRISERGGQLGPNLSQIGRIRQAKDLLEAILYPSATIVNGYEHYILETQDGEAYTGMIQRETKDAIYLKNTSLREQRVQRSQIERVSSSHISLMPSGFDQVLSRQELLDLVAFLKSCR